jgi:hypothetical protein
MGTFHREITIDKGLKGFVKHRGVSKKKHGARTIDDMTVVTVRDMVMGPAAGGSLRVRSSNLPRHSLGGGWSGLAKGRIETRLRDSDGEKKGRVLYASLETLNSGTVVVAALCYHLDRPGVIEIKSIDATTDLTDHRAKLFDGLLRCAEHIACEHSKGTTARLVFDITKDQARWYRETFDFREVGKSTQKSRVILGREGEACRARAKKKR